MYPLRRYHYIVPRLHYGFLTAPHLSLHILPSLINDSLNLSFGTQGRSWRLKPIFYKQEIGDTERPSCSRALQGPAEFQRVHMVTTSSSSVSLSFLLSMKILCGHWARIWRRQWQPTPVLLPGESHGRRSLVGCSPWGREESDTTERLHFHFSLSCIGEGNGNPLQCSCLENPRDGSAWWAAVYEVAQNWTRLKRLSSSSSGRARIISWVLHTCDGYTSVVHILQCFSWYKKLENFKK